MPSLAAFEDLKWDDGLLEVEGTVKNILWEAEQIFGKRHRDWQASAIQALVQKEDLFIKAGTSSGKSLVFQSMIARRPSGIVLVIVPLKSLMDDQVHLRTNGKVMGTGDVSRQYPSLSGGTYT